MPSLSSCNDGSYNECVCTHAASDEAKQQSPSNDLRRRQQRIVTGRRKLSASWKITMASLLLLLCDNSRNHNSQQSMVDAWGGSNATVHTTKKGLQLVGSCSQEDFQVQAVFLVCDSPGAYYRGSSTYRDSTTCSYGDKARLQLQCK
jgi:hypothetical protein